MKIYRVAVSLNQMTISYFRDHAPYPESPTQHAAVASTIFHQLIQLLVESGEARQHGAALLFQESERGASIAQVHIGFWRILQIIETKETNLLIDQLIRYIPGTGFMVVLESALRPLSGASAGSVFMVTIVMVMSVIRCILVALIVVVAVPSVTSPGLVLFWVPVISSWNR